MEQDALARQFVPSYVQVGKYASQTSTLGDEITSPHVLAEQALAPAINPHVFPAVSFKALHRAVVFFK